MNQYTGSDLVEMKHEVKKLAESWSTEIACYKACASAIKQATMKDDCPQKFKDWLKVLQFRQIHLLPTMTSLNLDSFKDYGTPERTYDLNVVFAQCMCMYDDFGDWMKEMARIANVKKEARKANAATNLTLMNLENEYKDLPSFVTDLRNAIDNKACVNRGTTGFSVYTWAPGTCRRYRTGTRIYRLDSRKTPLTAETLKAAADSILEVCGEGW